MSSSGPTEVNAKEQLVAMFLRRMEDIATCEKDVQNLIIELSQVYDMTQIYSALKIHVMFIEMDFRGDRLMEAVMAELVNRVSTHTEFRKSHRRLMEKLSANGKKSAADR